ncbi:unnamed protein product, partial [Chrysoparadoxa australica]
LEPLSNRLATPERPRGQSYNSLVGMGGNMESEKENATVMRGSKYGSATQKVPQQAPLRGILKRQTCTNFVAEKFHVDGIAEPKDDASPLGAALGAATAATVGSENRAERKDWSQVVPPNHKLNQAITPEEATSTISGSIPVARNGLYEFV